MKIIKIIKDNRLICIILLTGLFIKLSIAGYGLPHLFHPDEPYILKDPFKILYNYIHLNFSSTTNLYFWLASFWYALFYISGLIAGQINSFADFQTMIISESASLWYFGRMLSIILSLTGTVFLLLIIKRISADRILQFIFGLIIVLNPIEIMSDLWIKFDPAVYCAFSILFYLSYRYFIENISALRNKILILSIVAVSVRIDLLAFFIAFLFIDFKTRLSETNFKYYIRSTWRPLLKGVLFYLIITLLPVVLLYNCLGISDASGNLQVSQTFESAIVTKISNVFGFDSLLQSFAENFKFYFLNSTLITLGPLSILLFLFFLKKHFTSKFTKLFIITSLILSPPILIYIAHAPHYFLLISTIIIAFGIIVISEIKNRLLRYSFALFQLIYLGSITVSLVYVINFETDTRILSLNYILKHTTSNDLIAVERYMNPGLTPPVDECPDVLLEKIRIIQKYNMGTGETFKIKVKNVTKDDCRNILEVSKPKIYTGTEYENIWCIDFNPDLLNNLSPSFYISQNNYFLPLFADAFSKNIQAKYALEKVFAYDFGDPRIKVAIEGENYFPTFYFYKKIQ